jgi:baseplate hub protein gp41
MTTTNTQYLRRISLTVSSATQSIEFGQFRVVFNVRRGDMQTPNTLDVRIYNVKPATAALISKNEFTTVSLQAGYAGTRLGLIFTGTIVQFRQGRVNQQDSYVDITAADGDEAYNYATISTTVPAGTPQSNIAGLIASSMYQHNTAQPITPNPANPTFPQSQCVRGQVLFGMSKDEARAFALQNGCKWSLADGQLTFIPWTSFIQGGPILVISVSTGLIGTPEQTQQGISIKTLLNPDYKVGQLVRLDGTINQFRFGLDLQSSANNIQIAKQNTISTNLNPNATPNDQQGLYYIMCANHSGDTRGTEWYTDIVALSVDATLTNVPHNQQLFFTGGLPKTTGGAIQRFGGT